MSETESEYSLRSEALHFLDHWNQDAIAISLQLLRRQIDNLPTLVAESTIGGLKASLNRYYDVVSAYHNSMIQLQEVIKIIPVDWANSDCNRLYWDFMPAMGMNPNEWFLDYSTREIRNELLGRLEQAVDNLWARYPTDPYITRVAEKTFPDEARENLIYPNCDDAELLRRAYQFTLLSSYLAYELRNDISNLDVPAFDIYTEIRLINGEVVLIANIEYLIDLSNIGIERQNRLYRQYLIGIVEASRSGLINILVGFNDATQATTATGDATRTMIQGWGQAINGEKSFQDAGFDFVSWLAGALEGAVRGIGVPETLDAAQRGVDPYYYYFTPHIADVAASGWYTALDFTGISRNEIYQNTTGGVEVGFRVSSLITPVAEPLILNGINSLIAAGKVGSAHLRTGIEALNLASNQPTLNFGLVGGGSITSGGAIRIATAAEPIAGTVIQEVWSGWPIVMMSAMQPPDKNQNSSPNDDEASQASNPELPDLDEAYNRQCQPAGPYNCDSPRSRPAYGHSFDDHGHRRSIESLADEAARRGTPQSKFYNSDDIVAAERATRQSTYSYPSGSTSATTVYAEHNFGRPIGQVVMPDGTIIENVTWVRVIRDKATGMVRTCYPIRPEQIGGL